MTQFAEFLSRFSCSAAALILASAGCAGVSEPSVPDEGFAGILEIFEDSSFRTSNGEIYGIRAHGGEAQRLIASSVRDWDKSEPLCLRLSFSGRFLDEEDFVGRKIIAIRKLDRLEGVACP